MGNFERMATAQEMEIVRKVEQAIAKVEMEEYNEILEIVGSYCFALKPCRRTYGAVCRLAVKYGLTGDDMVTWYYITEQ